MPRTQFATTSHGAERKVPDLMTRLLQDEIRARIKQARERAGISQEEMAALMGVIPRTQQNWESAQGKSAKVPWERLNEISDVTGATVRWLIHGDDEEHYDGELIKRLTATTTALEKVETRLAEIAKRDITTEVQRALEDYTSRLGREVGKLPPRSMRVGGRRREDPPAAA